MKYPTVEHIVKLNVVVLTAIAVKRADRPVVVSRLKIARTIASCKAAEGDVFDKAVVLLSGLVRAHPFASGNRRTAFAATKDFLAHNRAFIGLRDEPGHARVMLGILEGFYTAAEIKEWITNGIIRYFKR
ncbi:Fic family protein [Candidatus Woesearchaeota archaeon]|nr:Fic family protein [Candidatus Woesearchaeota archaeon]